MNCDSVKARSWAGQIGKRRGSRSRSRRCGSRRLALCLSSLSVTASRRHGVATLPLCLSPSRTLAHSLVALASRSLTFLSSSFFFFLFFPLVFQFLLSPFGFGLLRVEIFSFFFFLVVDWHGLWPYELCSGLALARWWARGRGAGAKISGGPKPLFFFFGNFLLAKKFFFWARGGGGLGPP